ncbi:uncharacterized protein AMSG_02611 [Thecamonas trahens ATCC 50062]|uniref:F-box domain-containing protein n=1 Tax=Thecamonas trahens ATCC 50062 TaxID=461836 RepID=A0A0L0D6A5_THETB|nr:hypothetical protein AMSG_02611 [Thecamonas trahens ATCC 50062]KNC47586.1 hypothetical protein AMSG_02611 [Thecamonas trahens ATCC 50062]|eukprot:XP_013759516.1 hypothetical protein AMSG_02611 [Thecamonas trahens ATCC 50062]
MAATPSLQTTTPDACTSSLAPAGAHADDLPPELLLIIFGFLDPVTLNRVAGVSRSWRQWARDPVLWKTLSARHFPATRGSRPSTDWYKLYRGMFLAQVPRKRAAILRATDSTVDVPPLPRARPRPSTRGRLATLVFPRLPFAVDLDEIRGLASAHGFVLQAIIRRRRAWRGTDRVWSHPRPARSATSSATGLDAWAEVFIRFHRPVDALAAAAHLADLTFNGIRVGVACRDMHL